MSESELLGAAAELEAHLAARVAQGEHAEMRGRWTVQCHRNGELLWEDVIENLVVNAGLNHALDATLSAGTQITTWYLGLMSASPSAAAGDTMSSHGGWTEVTAYDEAARQTWTDGGVSGQSVSNSGSPAVFTISTNGTDVGGCFLTSVSTKSGTTGTLFAAGAFAAGNKSLDDGDTLTVTATFTNAAA